MCLRHNVRVYTFVYRGYVAQLVAARHDAMQPKGQPAAWNTI